MRRSGCGRHAGHSWQRWQLDQRPNADRVKLMIRHPKPRSCINRATLLMTPKRQVHRSATNLESEMMMRRIRTYDWRFSHRLLILQWLQCAISLSIKEHVMEPINLNYQLLRAAVARGDRAHIEALARKLRDQHIAHLLQRAATGAWSVITAIGRGVSARRKHRYEVAPGG